MQAARGIAGHVGNPEEVRGVISKLLEIVNETGLERTIAIGQVVLDSFFGGSPDLWRDRRCNKNNSVRRLADCAECPLSRSALNQAIAVCVAVQTMPAIRSLRAVGASHISAVLALPRVEQKAWLLRADAERWSVRRLAEEIKLQRRLAGERRGRPKASDSDRARSRLRALLKALDTAITGLETEEDFPSGDAELTRLSQRLENVRHRLVGTERGVVRCESMLVGPPAPTGTFAEA